MSQPAVASPSPAIPRTLLWPLRIATLIFAVLCLVPLGTAAAERHVAVPWLFGVPLFVGYAIVLAGLIGDPPRRSAPALAASVGGILCVLFVAWSIVSSFGRDPAALIAIMGTLAVVQLGYAALAVAVYRRTLRKPEERGTGVTAFVLGLILVGCSLFILTDEAGRERWPAAGTQAMGAIRSIVTAEMTYAAAYGNYSATLAVLGPPAEGQPASAEAADLVDQFQARGDKHGYIFIYTPTRDAKGVITGFILIARPKQYGKPEQRSFFVDDSGVIRTTKENRAATAQDPPIS